MHKAIALAYCVTAAFGPASSHTDVLDGAAHPPPLTAAAFEGSGSNNSVGPNAAVVEVEESHPTADDASPP